MPVITVTRQYGSGGSEVARLAAERLGWTLIDNEFVDEVARRAGLPAEEVAQREERAPGLLERMARTLAVASPEMFIATGAGGAADARVPQVEVDEERIVTVTERIIAEAAAEGRVVLVGRGAQAVLAARPDALHVYVTASQPWRERAIAERLGVSPVEAARAIEEVETHRDRYVKTHYGRHRRDVENYDLVVNAERLGIENAAALVVAEARRRGWQ
jgi:cytidylate kinase